MKTIWPDGRITEGPPSGGSNSVSKSAARPASRKAAPAAPRSAAERQARIERIERELDRLERTPLDQDKLVRQLKADLARNGITDAVLAKEEARRREDQATALEDQARDWRERSRVIGLDRGVREYMLAKAAQAEEQAAELRAGVEPETNLAKVLQLDSEAGRMERLAKSTGDLELSTYYAERGKELRSQAAVSRGARDG